MTTLTPLPDRRVSGPHLRRLLGAWQQPGAAYVALADALRGAILAGSLPLSSRVPSERELAESLAVSRTTITAAYELLRTEGFLSSRRGSGTVTTLPADARPAPARRSSSAARLSTSSAHEPDGMVDLSTAAPSAPSALHGAYVAALDSLPRHLRGSGYEPLGLPVLREAIARRYTERGTPTTPDQILVTTGAQHAISLLVAAHVGPGDRVVVEQPTYPQALEAVRGAGARPVPVPSGSGGLDVDLLEATVRQVSPRLVYLIPDHRNPTGTSLSTEQRERVRAIARRYRTVIVGDEVLTDLTIDGPAPTPWAGAGDDVVTIGSASKSFWGGLRVGWVRGHPDLVTRLGVARGRVDIATAVLEQLVTAELLADPDRVLVPRRARLRAQRDLLADLLATHLPTWTVPVPRGGLSLWVDLGAPLSSALTTLGLRHGVRLLPGPAFGVDGGLEDRLRVTFTSTPDELERGVRAMAAAWTALDPRTATRRPSLRAVV
ncbi:MocR-like transcription factor YczR [Cellulomonas hominis]